MNADPTLIALASSLGQLLKAYAGEQKDGHAAMEIAEAFMTAYQGKQKSSVLVNLPMRTAMKDGDSHPFIHEPAPSISADQSLRLCVGPDFLTFGAFHGKAHMNGFVAAVFNEDRTLRIEVKPRLGEKPLAFQLATEPA